MEMPSEETLACYSDLIAGTRFAYLTNRMLLRVSGRDSAKFLNNFCTADVVKLESGKTTEAFFLNVKGKILAHGHLAKLDSEVLFFAHGSEACPELMEHLDRYIISEDVELENLSHLDCLFFCGEPSNESMIRKLFHQVPQPNEIFDLRPEDADEVDRILCAQLDIVGLGWLIATSEESGQRLERLLDSHGYSGAFDREAVEMIRLERNTPWFGVDFDLKNLPQEVDRDAKAISFNKGCYLGQETVARIDSLGQVNKLLRSLEFSESAPKIGEELRDRADESKPPAGVVSSVAWSPQKRIWIGLGMVKRKYLDQLDSLIW